MLVIDFFIYFFSIWYLLIILLLYLFYFYFLFYWIVLLFMRYFVNIDWKRCVKIVSIEWKGEDDVRTYSEEWIRREYLRIYSRFCWNLKIYAHVKRGADVYVSSKKCCEDLYRKLYAMGQLTNTFYRKIDNRIDRTYNHFLETGEIIEFH